MDNTVRTTKGIEIYQDNIRYFVDEYLNDLDDKDTIRKTPVFKGMLKYIYNNCFKITDKDVRYNNKSSNIDYADIDVINNLWEIYTALCYKYCQAPTILNFSLFTGISVDAFNTWRNGDFRGDNGDGVTSQHCQSYKRWLKECESAAYDLALSGNPGGMFILKANYGYTEMPQRLEIVNQGGASRTPEQIAEEYGRKAIGGEVVTDSGGLEADF